LQNVNRGVVKTQGITLIEILIVIAIVGILAGLAVSNITQSRDINLIRTAQTQMAKDFEKARSLARRYSYSYKIKLDIAGNKYDIAPVSTTATTYPEVHASLPFGVEYDGTPTKGTEITYSAPLGRMDSSNLTILLRLKNNTAIKTKLDVIGVTGMVVSRGLTK
jgi:prepilin-type N-terminal cleavage/methylation domain-containing protein